MSPEPIPSLSPRERTHLKGRAHSLEPVVRIGHAGLTEPLVAEVDRALTAHELIKVKVEGERDAREEIGDSLAEGTNAAVVQRVGKVLVLWRPRQDELTSPAN